ncbi:MAG: PspA/IM30 family protein [Bacillota bacterium]|nr:PspA/IM30 family protein [Bacillota bacterium]
MSILSRFGDIMKANINALLEKAEDPGKLVDQYLVEAMENLAEVKKETAGVMAEESRTKRLVDENNKEVAKYTELAKKALLAGNEADAKVFVAKKQELENHGASLQMAYAVAHENALKMRQLHDKLTKDISGLNQRRAALKAKLAVAKTQETINKFDSRTVDMQGTLGALDRMEQKVDRKLDVANAMAELNAAPEDSADALEAKYGDESTSVEAELAELKASLGL